MEQLERRVRKVINDCWNSFSHEVGGGSIYVNKEATMQLEYACMLKNRIGSIIQNQDESVGIELETGIEVDGKFKECDVVIYLKKENQERRLPIEMKCYKKITSSGKRRDGYSLFMKKVYQDLQLIESYRKNDHFINGVQLTMTDFTHIVSPVNRRGIMWDWDISDGHEIINGNHKEEPVSGNGKGTNLKGNYIFKWVKAGDYYFLKLENNG